MPTRWGNAPPQGARAVPSAYAQEVMADSPLLYWRLGELSGTTANDQSGNGRTGTYDTGVTLGQPGALFADTDRSAGFDGTAAAYVSSNYNPWTTDSARTFEGWAYRTNTSSDNALFWGNGNGSADPYLKADATSTGFRFSANTASGESVTWADACPTASTFHWVLTFDDPGNVAELFINGVSKGTRTVNAQYHAAITAVYLSTVASGNAWNGRQDEFAIYPAILSAARITAHYNAGVAFSPPRIAGLKYWLAPAGLTGVDADPITTWDDSGTLNADGTQSVAAKKPVIDTDVSPRAALFDNVDDQLDSTDEASQKPATVFGVVKVPNVDDNQSIVGGDDALAVYITAGTGLLTLRKSGHADIASSTSAVPTAAFFYFVVSYSATGAYVIRINGAAAGSGTNDLAFSSPRATRIGVDYGGTNWMLNGHMRHVGKYDTVISGTDLTNLETYLAGQL